jgi:hypothetical protein
MNILCPYCEETPIPQSKAMKCAGCGACMKAERVVDIEERAKTDDCKTLYVGISSLRKKPVKMILLSKIPQEFFESDVYAIYPTGGLGANSPLVIAGNLASEYQYSQPHPQLDTPFTRFFVKGLLYSAFANSILYIIFGPPAWMFWASTLSWAGVYYYLTRKTTKCN